MYAIVDKICVNIILSLYQYLFVSKVILCFCIWSAKILD